NAAETGLRLTRVPPPDLVLAGITAPSTIPAGQPVWVTWTLRNDGASDALGPWEDALQLADSAGGPAFVELARVPFTGLLAAGASVTRSNLVVLAPTLAGSRFVRAVADVDDRLPETDDTGNNSRTMATASQVTAPNLVVQSLTVPATAVAGTAVPVSWSVRNAGNAAVMLPWTDRLIFNGPDGSQVLLDRRVEDQVPLGAGAAYSRSVSVPLPLLTGAGAGARTLSLITDFRADVAESVETDNTRESVAVAVSLPPMPDLAVQTVAGPGDAFPGGEVELVWTVVNLGEAPVPAPWQERLFLSADAVPGDDLELATVEIGESLAAGASVSRTNRVRLPLSLAGVFRFVAATDSAGDVVEQDESNNLGIATVPTALPARLTLDLPTLTVREDADPPTLRGRLFRSGGTATPLQVTLTSSDPGELQTLDRVTLPAGSSAVDVNFGIVADGVVDGSRPVTLTASAPGMLEGTALVTVQDADRFPLVLELDAASVVEGGSVGAAVFLPDALGRDLEVLIHSTDLGLGLP
ncbi:MAG: hypothetical protein KDM81_16460, partial [Verrucomicrobiae bacterium]|nr:hypothetical protein [Verrucomicrobiae bacterium]